MKNLKVELSALIKDCVLDVLPMPQGEKTLKAQLKALLSKDAYIEIEDAINELIVAATESGYDVGYKVALSLTQGKTDITIVTEA